MTDKKAQKTVVINDPQIAKQILDQQEITKLLEARKRASFEAICELSDPVCEDDLLKHLPVLDTSSWAEVVEERFLGRLCGYPICTNTIAVDFQKKFIVKRDQVVKTDAEPNKYCSVRCQRLSHAIRVQLHQNNDSNIQGSTRLVTHTQQSLYQHQQKSSPETNENKLPKKHFWIPTDDGHGTQYSARTSDFSGTAVVPLSELEHPPQIQQQPQQSELVRSLHELKVADNEDSSDEDMRSGRHGHGAHEGLSSDYDSEEEENKFLEQLRNFMVSTGGGANRRTAGLETKGNDSATHQKVPQQMKQAQNQQHLTKTIMDTANKVKFSNDYKCCKSTISTVPPHQVGRSTTSTTTTKRLEDVLARIKQRHPGEKGRRNLSSAVGAGPNDSLRYRPDAIGAIGTDGESGSGCAASPGAGPFMPHTMTGPQIIPARNLNAFSATPERRKFSGCCPEGERLPSESGELECEEQDDEGRENGCFGGGSE